MIFNEKFHYRVIFFRHPVNNLKKMFIETFEILKPWSRVLFHACIHTVIFCSLKLRLRLQLICRSILKQCVNFSTPMNRGLNFCDAIKVLEPHMFLDKTIKRKK